MSDDEVLRRRAPLLALAGLGAVVGLGAYFRAGLVEDSQAFEAFCGATHVGEELEHVRERATSRGYGFSKHGSSGPPGTQRPGAESWLASAEFFGYRAGCTIEVVKGRVVSKRFAELP